MSVIRSAKVAKVVALAKSGKTALEIVKATGFNYKTVRNTINYHLQGNSYNKNGNAKVKATRTYARKNVVVLDVVRVNRQLERVRTKLTNLHTRKVQELRNLSKALKQLAV
jgi:predicted transcriptional regulator